MSRWGVLSMVVAAACACAASASGKERSCGVRAAAAEGQRFAVDDVSLAIAPFAIPVAVPVATVQRPTLFYAYGAYAPPPAPGVLRIEASEATGTAAPAVLDAPESASNAGGVAIRDRVERLFRQRCAACHSASKAQGGLALFEENGALIERLRRRAILDMVAHDERGVQRMPPAAGPKLSSAEIESVRRWAEPPAELEY